MYASTEDFAVLCKHQELDRHLQGPLQLTLTSLRALQEYLDILLATLTQ